MRSVHVVRVREIIVVEGIHDKQAVERVIEGDIWVIGGDRIAERFLRELERASASRGVIVLTDPDGAGERIRKRIGSRIPHCKHAFLPRREATSVHGLGVEHASDQAILKAIQQVRPTVIPPGEATFTMDDLLVNGLAGQPFSALARERIGDALGIGTGNAKAFLRKLNALGITRSEWECALTTVRRDIAND